MSATYNALAATIAQEENSTWVNNPGALQDAFGNPINFGSYQSGYSALLNKLQYDISGQSQVYSPNMTLGQFENVYTGGDTNAGNNVASMLGVPASTPVSQLSDQSLQQNSSFLQNAIDLAKNAVNNVLHMGTMNPSDAAAMEQGKVPDYSKTQGGGISSIGADVAAVLVGLVLIAGAVFTFSKVQETIISTAKRGAELAAA